MMQRLIYTYLCVVMYLEIVQMCVMVIFNMQRSGISKKIATSKELNMKL